VISRLLDAPPPSFQDVADTPAAARAISSKRVFTARLRAELDIPWAYRSFEEGLAAILGVPFPPLPESGPLP
jgi:hypothetical protein